MSHEHVIFRTSEQLARMGAIQVGRGMATSDGHYWLQSYKEGPYRTCGQPDQFWIDRLNEAQVHLVMDS